MRCEKCGAGFGPAAARVGLNIHTDLPEGYLPAIHGPRDFTALFGFWDQRTQSSLELCGACVCEALRRALGLLPPARWAEVTAAGEYHGGSGGAVAPRGAVNLDYLGAVAQNTKSALPQPGEIYPGDEPPEPDVRVGGCP